jgi:hypothetical protein
MRPRWWFTLPLLFAWLTCVGEVMAQAPPSSSTTERIRATAKRSSLPEEALAPVLAGLARLEGEGLPTERFADRMVECIAKRAQAGAIQSRAQRIEQDTRSARTLLRTAQSEGLVPPSPPAEEKGFIEDLADALQSSPLAPQDLGEVRRLLKSDAIPRILAGADSLAHLRRMGLEEPLIRKILAACPPPLPDEELRTFPSTLFTGRRCGMKDTGITADIVKHLAGGGKPTELTQKWSQSPAFRKGRSRNPDWSPGSGQGPGPGGGQGGRGQGRGRGGGRG